MWGTRGDGGAWFPRRGSRSGPCTISGFQRKLTPKNLVRNAQTVVRMFTASAEAKRIIKAFAAGCVRGHRGLRQRPGHPEAAKLGIPCVIHESNAYPASPQMLAKSVKTVMLAVPGRQEVLP